MTKASDNEFPSLLIKEGTAPSSPASGDQRLYIDSTSHHLTRKNSSGTVTDIESSAGIDISALTIERAQQPITDYALFYDGSAAANRGLPLGYVRGGRGGMTIYDDCFFRGAAPTTPPYEGGVNDNNSGTAAGTSVGTGIASHPGIITLSTGSTSSGRCALVAVNSVTFAPLGGGKVRFGSVFKLPTLSDGTNTYTARSGMGSQNAGDGDGVFFRYTHGTNSGKWQIVCRSGGVETATDTAITADTSYHTYEFEVNAAGTSVQAIIDGTNAGSPVTTNIPTAALGLTPFSIVKSLGGTARTIDADAYWLHQEFTTAR